MSIVDQHDAWKVDKSPSIVLNGRRVSYIFAFMLFVTALCVSIFFVDNRILLDSANMYDALTFIGVGLLSCFGLYNAAYSRPFTLNTAHWLFIVVFFFYAGIVQFLGDTPPDQAQTGSFARVHDIVNYYLMGWCVLYYLAYTFWFKKQTKKVVATDTAQEKQVMIRYHSIAIICVIATILAILLIGVDALISRAALAATSATNNDNAKADTLVAQTVCRAIPVFCLALILYVKPANGWYHYPTLALVSLCTLITNNPFAYTRFWIGAVLMGLVCIGLRKSKHTAMWLPIGLCLGLFVALPVLNLARYTLTTDINFAHYHQDDLYTILSSGDFDAYEQLCNTVNINPNLLPNTGSQLVGNALFFVPRKIWKEKPDGSGKFIADHFGLAFDDLSEPLPAEGYINFGLTGLLAYAIVFGLVLAHLDARYWKAEDNASLRGAPDVLRLAYPFLVGFAFVMMRGDFLSTFSWTCGLIASAWLVTKVSRTQLMLGL
jgi:hypothetical protein